MKLPARHTGAQMMWLLLWVVNLGIICFLWYGNSNVLITRSSGGFLTATGRLCGLIAAYSLLWQIILMSRLQPLEKAFGRLFITWMHRYNGYLAFSFLIIHPILLTYAYRIGTARGFWSQFVRFVTSYEDVWKALIAFLLIITLVSASVTIARRHLKYETWYFVHLASYVAIILAFGHQTALGGDFIRHALFKTYWYMVYGIVAAVVLYYRIAIPWYRTWWHRFTVEKVVQETHDVVSIYISGRHMDAFHYEPGQFARWRFLSSQLWWQMHPFSLSKPYDGKSLRLTVKASGDYTRQLQSVPLGTLVMLDGPHGMFTPALRTQQHVVLIAGGIGITPLFCMLESFSAASVPVTLLYACRTPADIAFRAELENRIREKKITVHYVVDDQPEPSMQKGRLTQQVIAKLVPDIATSDVYLCGPPPMVTAIQRELTVLGVSDRFIHSEKFSY